MSADLRDKQAAADEALEYFNEDFLAEMVGDGFPMAAKHIAALCAMIAPAPPLSPASASDAVGYVTISHFRGVPQMENREFDYCGDLPPGTHALYTRPAPAVQEGEAVAWRVTWDWGADRISQMFTKQPHSTVGKEGCTAVVPLYTHPPIAPVDDAMAMGFYLASFKRPHDQGHVVWWGPDIAGYTSDLASAGIYTDIKPDYHDSAYTVPVPVSFMRGKRLRQMLDAGDSGNGMFHSAALLRAALTAAKESP